MPASQARLTVGDFEDLQTQLLRTREQLYGSQTRERAALLELGRARTELDDLREYSQLQGTREALLREDLARLQHTLARIVGDGADLEPHPATPAGADAASPLEAAGRADVAGSPLPPPPPPPPAARRKLEGQLTTATTQLARREAEARVLAAELDVAEGSAAELAAQRDGARSLLRAAAAEQHRTLAALHEREKALYETRQLAAALHLRVSNFDSVASAERAALSSAKQDSDDLGSAYRDAQRIAAAQHAQLNERLCVLKRRAGARMAAYAAHTALRAVLHAWRHCVERTALFRQIKALSIPKLAAAAPPPQPPPHGGAPAAAADASAAAGAAAAHVDEADEARAPGHTGAHDPSGAPLGAPAASASLDAPLAPTARGGGGAAAASADAGWAAAQRAGGGGGAYVDPELAARGARLRRWWTAELSVLAASLAELESAAGAELSRARSEAAALGGALDGCEGELGAARAREAALGGGVGDADVALREATRALARSRAEAALCASAASDADAALGLALFALQQAQAQLTEAAHEATLGVRRSESLSKQLQRSLREEVHAHARTREKLAAELDEARAELERSQQSSQLALSEATQRHAAELSAAHAAARASAARDDAGGKGGGSAPLSPGGVGGEGADPAASASASPLPHAAALTPSSSRSWLASALDGLLSAGTDSASRLEAEEEEEGAAPEARRAAPPGSAAAGGVGAGAGSGGGRVAAVLPTTADSAALGSPPPPASAAPALDNATRAALLSKLQHLSTQNGYLRERVSLLEESAASLQEELEKKRTLMHHLYALVHGPLPPETSDTTRQSVVHRWVGSLLEPGVGGLLSGGGGGAAERRREREVADAMETILEEALLKNMQLQRDVEALSGQCARLRRLLAESYRTDAGRPSRAAAEAELASMGVPATLGVPADGAAGSAASCAEPRPAAAATLGAALFDARAEPGADTSDGGGGARHIDTQLGRHWRAVAGTPHDDAGLGLEADYGAPARTVRGAAHRRAGSAGGGAAAAGALQKLMADDDDEEEEEEEEEAPEDDEGR